MGCSSTPVLFKYFVGQLVPKGFWRRQVDLNHQRAKQKEEQLLASQLILQSPLRTVPLNGDVKHTLGNPL